jgi:hypothetical protein
VGRYQLVVVSAEEGVLPNLFLADTASGHCWIRNSHPNDKIGWRDFGSPTASAKR